MATTSIWSIKNNLKQSINYIINPEKTLNKDYGNRESYSYLEEQIKNYNFKEEKVCYVSCLNCDEDNPCDDMEFTKEIFRKKDTVMKFADYIELKCLNEEIAKAVSEQIDAYKAYSIDQGIYYGIDDDELKITGRAKGSNVYIEIPRPDYEGLYDPDFFDDSLEALCTFLDEKVPGAVLSGNREYNNPDIYRSMQEIASRVIGKLSTMTVVEVDWEEIKELMDNGADISEVCSILNMDEDEVWDGLSSLEEGEDE